MPLQPDPLTVDQLKETERAWHDAMYLAHAPGAYPGSPEVFEDLFLRQHLTPFCEGGWSWWADARCNAVATIGDIRGLRVLDYGCGYGGLGIFLALRGAEVWGFDLSLPAINVANKAAADYGVPAQFAQMDAGDLTYADNFFDLVVGFGVLHHVVKYPRVGTQLLRVLKPEGRAVFHETLWDNPLVNFARRFTTEHSDAGDAALTDRRIREFAAGFSGVTLEKLHLLYMLKRMAKLPVQDWQAKLKPRPFWRAVKALDNLLLSFKPLRRYCGEVNIYLRK
jgi:SAM-dependent methyltransferase